MAEYDGGNATATYGDGTEIIESSYAEVVNENADIIQLRRDVEANWIATDPVLAEGEIGLCIDKNYLKIGDGQNKWSQITKHGYDGNITQELGDSTNSVVSQKVITELLNSLETTIDAETTRATKAEQTLTENLNTAITNINNTTNQNVFCTTKEGNEIFKEVYIYPYVGSKNVKEITITKQTTKYQITFKDSNNAYSYIYLGNNNAVINAEVISGVIQGAGFGSGATMYAVIDWSKVVDDKPISTNFTSLINDSKYSPIITHVMQSYKFVRGSLGNAFIRELYLENLRRTDTKEDGTSQTHYYSFTPNEIQNSFVLSAIGRNVDSTWTINFGAIGTNGSFYPFKYETTENPENNDVIKADIHCWIGSGERVYSATMYAVVDWTQIPNGTSVSYGRRLLSGVVQKKLSPIITDYIGNKIEWSSSFNMNDYYTQGIYYITGERKATADNLPIMNTGHVSGQLTVLDANGCVTQYLCLTNNGGSEGREYIRTLNSSNSSPMWSDWRELKQTANLGQISDEKLKNVVDNGYYEGVILNSYADLNNLTLIIQGFIDTVSTQKGTPDLVTGTLFSMDVLNNYAIASEASHLLGVAVPRSVTQVAKIQLVNNGYYDGTSFFIVQRTKIGDGAWSNWKMINII